VVEDHDKEDNRDDSDEETEDVDLHDLALCVVMSERAEGGFVGADDKKVIVEDTDANLVLLEWGSNVKSCPNVHIPGTPSDWVEPAPKLEKGEPPFASGRHFLESKWLFFKSKWPQTMQT